MIAPHQPPKKDMQTDMQTDIQKGTQKGTQKNASKGVGHWWHQRLTAIGLVPLVVYAVVGLITAIDSSHQAAIAWVQAPLNATVLLLLFGAGFYHASLGMQVIIEDYIADERRRLIMLVALRLSMSGLAGLALFSTLAVALS